MNTATKRFAALLVTLPFRCVSPIPDGVIASGDRPVPVYRYALAGASPAAVIPIKGWMAQVAASSYITAKHASCSVVVSSSTTFAVVE